MYINKKKCASATRITRFNYSHTLPAFAVRFSYLLPKDPG